MDPEVEIAAWEEYQRAKVAVYEAEEIVKRARERLFAATAAWKSTSGVRQYFYSSTDSTTDVAYGGNHPWEEKK